MKFTKINNIPLCYICGFHIIQYWCISNDDNTHCHIKCQYNQRDRHGLNLCEWIATLLLKHGKSIIVNECV